MSSPDHFMPRTHHRLRALQGIYLSQTCLTVLIRVVAYSWLLQDVGSRDLPWTYVMQAVPLSLLTFALIGVVDKVGRATLLSAVVLLSGAGTAALAAASMAGVPWISPLFLMWGETTIGLLGMHFWLLANELLSPDQARIHFPSLAFVGAIGAIIGGVMVHQATPGDAQGLLVLLIPPGMLCVALAAWVQQRYGYRLGLRRRQSERVPWTEELQAGLRLFKISPLLRWLCALTALTTAAGLVADLLFSAAAEQSQSTSRLPVLLGGMQVTVNLLQLLLVWLFGARIFSTFGLIRTLGTYPAGGMLLAGAGLFTGAHWPLFTLKVFDRLENYLVLNPGVALTARAFHRDHRGRAGLIYGGLVKPLSILVTGLALLLVQHQRQVLMVSMLVIAVLFYGMLHFLSKAYQGTLIENLDARDPRLVVNSIDALAECDRNAAVPVLMAFQQRTREPLYLEHLLATAGRLGDPRFLPGLLAALHGANRSLKRAAAGALAQYPGQDVRDALLRALRNEDSSRVKASILSALNGALDKQAYYPLLQHGLHDPDPRVRANAVEAIGLTGDPGLVEGLLPLLEDPVPRVQSNAIVALARARRHREQWMEALSGMFDGHDRLRWLSALYAAGEVREKRFEPVLFLAVESIDLDVRRNAAVAMGKRDLLAAVAPLFALLGGPDDQAVAVALVLDRLGPNVREALLERLCRGSHSVRGNAIRALRSCGVNYPEELEQLEAIQADTPEPRIPHSAAALL